MIKAHLLTNKHILEIIPTSLVEGQTKEEDIKQTIENLAVEVGGALQLSLRQLSSDYFTSFIQRVIMETGHYVLSHPNEAFIPTTIFGGLSRNSIKHRIISHSHEKITKAKENL